MRTENCRSPPAYSGLACAFHFLLGGTSDARQLCRSVLWASVPGGDYWKLQFCRLGKGEGLLFARIVPRIDIVELQGGASVNLNNDFARGHRVMVHVRIEIGKAAGGE
jgi:hypothetical protein